MAEAADNAPQKLSELRTRIDAIDEKMHRLLMERGSVVDALIAAKGTSRSRVAFRPQREADMMRRLVARHEGSLPLATVEHLWREIISTFTFMQAPFRLIIHYGDDPVAIHDLARFVFGFSVELVQAEDPAEVISIIADTGGDLGLIPLDPNPVPAAWWRGLTMADGPRVMAISPFIAGKGIPADAPAVIVSPALPDPAPFDLVLFAALSDSPSLAIDGPIAVARSTDGDRHELLLAVDRKLGRDALEAAGLRNIAEIGGAARGLSLDSAGDRMRDPKSAVTP